MNPAIAFAVDLPDEAATAGLAGRLAKRTRRGDVIGLEGDLGSGKTSFARAFIRALGSGAEEVPSPTFTLVETYAFPDRPPVWHFDLYRLTAPEQAYELGIEEAKVNKDGGAIALGHPLGATGARITGKAASLLKREGKRYALATQCIGGGQGIATILERA